jgi:hypothetical protein
MSLASEIWNWQEGNRVYSRLTTNVGREKLIARLRALGLLDSVESIHAYFGDRVYGGSGYQVLWKEHVCLEDLRRLVAL